MWFWLVTVTMTASLISTYSTKVVVDEIGDSSFTVSAIQLITKFAALDVVYRIEPKFNLEGRPEVKLPSRSWLTLAILSAFFSLLTFISLVALGHNGVLFDHLSKVAAVSATFLVVGVDRDDVSPHLMWFAAATLFAGLTLFYLHDATATPIGVAVCVMGCLARYGWDRTSANLLDDANDIAMTVHKMGQWFALLSLVLAELMGEDWYTSPSPPTVLALTCAVTPATPPSSWIQFSGKTSVCTRFSGKPPKSQIIHTHSVTLFHA
ncbi:hypothetical protein DIPPA_09797 [Diplonema papillatum]|nr:hypothetical protein DIPPA_09797 [Diplonema papillatum]